MKKIKLLTIVLFVLGAGGVVLAAEVINIDLNGYNDDSPYIGNGAYDVGESVWTVYYGGWGKPAGSPRSNSLADYNEPNKPGTYAAQVWIGDPGTNHTYESGTELMDDGFVKDPCAMEDPTIRLWGIDAYGGTFDVYVYGANDGNFTLSSPIYGPNTKHVSGGFDGDFIEGENYVIFESVPISFDPNYITLSYTNKLNGLQLVKLKQPVAVGDETVINAPDYDVAYDTNRREGEGQHFGPDQSDEAVFYLDTGEYMEYDITVDEVNEGYYRIFAHLTTPEGEANDLDIYLDDIPLGTLYLVGTYTNPAKTANKVSVNLFEGSHTFKWVSTGPYLWFNIFDFEFERVGDIVMNDCNDVYKYGFNYAADYTGDCHVDGVDLALIADNWLNCYDPNTDNCP